MIYVLDLVHLGSCPKSGSDILFRIVVLKKACTRSSSLPKSTSIYRQVLQTADRFFSIFSRSSQLSLNNNKNKNNNSITWTSPERIWVAFIVLLQSLYCTYCGPSRKSSSDSSSTSQRWSFSRLFHFDMSSFPVFEKSISILSVPRSFASEVFPQLIHQVHYK